ncbi:helix-turn-helix domain-containing protein [Halomicroarcula limicola]|uniref:Helix-turn-helix domain-containing protein n=1 Tax=Haloarcula limicola TaxID=1429915 RepID=A0A8J7Y7D7_9EURY|nr:helix-turn-helix domain-containing protein [Halomicroarcula limicola]MBV0925622.1 helix-turn-helix domain-containing protein [Halomicroarcula limicola]
MSLLPSRDPAVPDAEPRVIGVDSEDADDVLSALSSETARNLLAALNREPAPPAELADRVDTSLQNAQYHLKKLEKAGAVEVVDTAYSEKGREMDVFAPANQPLVICAGDEKETSGLRAAISNLLGGLAVVGLTALFVQQLFGRGLGTFFGPTIRSGSGDTGGVDPSFYIENGTVADGGTPYAVDAASQGGADAVAGLPPGLAFFAGGAFVLFALGAIWYARR